MTHQMLENIVREVKSGPWAEARNFCFLFADWKIRAKALIDKVLLSHGLKPVAIDF